MGIVGHALHPVINIFHQQELPSSIKQEWTTITVGSANDLKGQHSDSNTDKAHSTYLRNDGSDQTTTFWINH